ncbi:MAG: Hsp20/alpha crystallin family protein [Thermodesulfobacteriota bacterium]
MFAIRKWEPFKELSTIQSELDDLFRKTFGSLTPGMMMRGEMWRPSMNCFMRDGSYVVQADLPGIDPKDIEVSVVGDTLTVKGERKTEWKKKKEGHIFHESSYGLFERTLQVPEGVEADKVHATYKNGVLELTMPAGKAALPKKVKVEVEEEKIGSKAA